MNWTQYVNIVPNKEQDCKIVLGEICSGKNTFSNQFIFHKMIDISQIVRNLVTTNERVFNKDLDKAIIEELDNIINTNKHIIIVGIRQQSILNFILTKIPSSEIFWLDVPSKILEQRFIKRNSWKDKKITFLQATTKDNELGLSEVKQFIKQNIQNKQYSIEIIKNY